MKKILLAVTLVGAFIYFISCGKTTPGYVSCTNAPVDNDSSALLTFARANMITPVRDTSGLYYQIITQGTGTTPDSNSRVYVTYTGTFMDGAIFDSTTNSATTGFIVSGLLAGWKIGLSKIQTGGRIKLLLPSALAYGCVGAGNTIPPNSPVFFDITLVSLQ